MVLESIEVNVTGLVPRIWTLLQWDLNEADVEFHHDTMTGNVEIELPEHVQHRHRVLVLLRNYGLSVKGL